MKFSLLSVLFLALPIFTVAQVNEPSLNLYFGYDLDALTDEHRIQLREFVSSLECDSVFLQVSGHTDNHASDEYNIALSKRRVSSVVRGLEKLGLQSTQLITSGKGESSPVTDNETDKGRAQNRRVEIRIEWCDQTFDDVSDREPLTLATLLDSIQLSPVVHSMKGIKAAAVDVGEQGVLFIPEEAFFNTRTRRVERGDIELHISYIELEGDLIRSRVVTRTSTGILQSAGMIKVVPMKGNDTLRFAKTLRMLYFRDVDASFGAFVGYDNTAQNAIYWQQPSSDTLLFDGPSSGFLNCKFQGLDCNWWCRFKSWVGGIFSSNERTLTLDEQKVLEYAFPNGIAENPADSLKKLYEEHNVDEDEPVVEVLKKMYADEMDELGVDDFSEFYKYKEIEKERERFMSGEGNLQDFGGALNISTNGWNNLDKLMKIRPEEQVELRIPNIGPYSEDYVRVIVPDYDICVEPINGAVSPLKKGEDVIVIGIRVTNGLIYLAKAELELEDYSTVVPLDYREVSFDEMQEFIVKMENNLFY